MKVRKLGLQWGPAYEEAWAHAITHGGARVEVFVNDNDDLEIVIPGDQSFTIVPGESGKLRIILASDD